jgi:pyruvate dehydrogenase E1 component beta subunit
LKIALPSTPYDAKGLLKAAIRDNNPVVYLFHKLLLDTKGAVPENDYVVPLGSADIKREGSDVTVVAASYMVKMALDVADRLATAGISAEVIDIRTLEPLDLGVIVGSVEKTGRVVVVDEDVSRCGVTAEIALRIIETVSRPLLGPVKRVAAANLPVPAGHLERSVLPKPQDIADAIGTLMGVDGRLVVEAAPEEPGFSVG